MFGNGFRKLKTSFEINDSFSILVFGESLQLLDCFGCEHQPKLVLLQNSLLNDGHGTNDKLWSQQD